MSRPLLIQFGILSLILVIIFFSYKLFLRDNNYEKKLSEKKIEIKENNVSNKIESLKYSSIDKNGNKYEIFSNSGEVNEINNNLLELINVYAQIDLKKSGVVYIYANNAKYNKLTLDTHFYNNVRLNYKNHNINSNDIFLNYLEKKIKIENNVMYNDHNNTLNADIVEFDLITKMSKIYMIDKNNKIKALVKN